MRKTVWTLVILAFGFGALWAGEKESKQAVSPLAGFKPWEVPFIPPEVEDSFGAADTLFLELQKGEKEGAWVLFFHVFNDESLFALSFPVRHDSLMAFDSISIEGTRVDFFQTKMVNKPPSVPNTVTVGLFTAMNPMAASLPPGRGLVMKMFFTAPASRPISIRSVATIKMPPSLEFVVPRGIGIHPAVVRVGDSPASEEKPAKPALPSKSKKKG